MQRAQGQTDRGHTSHRRTRYIRTPGARAIVIDFFGGRAARPVSPTAAGHRHRGTVGGERGGRGNRCHWRGRRERSLFGINPYIYAVTHSPPARSPPRQRSPTVYTHTNVCLVPGRRSTHPSSRSAPNRSRGPFLQFFFFLFTFLQYHADSFCTLAAPRKHARFPSVSTVQTFRTVPR